MNGDRRLSEGEARRLWRRATELQMEAARRLETAAEAGGEGTPGVEDDTGYALADVREAAREAGIDPTYLDRALAELDAAGAVGETGRSGALTERFLGDQPDVLVVSHGFDAPAERVYEALRIVVPRPPFKLEVVESRGHPLEGGTLVLRMPSIWTGPSPGELAYEVRGWAGIKDMHLAIRETGDGESCEVTLACPLARSKRINVWTHSWLSGLVALMGGAAGVSILTSAVPLGLILTVLTVVWTVASPPALLYGGMAGSRALYAYSLERARKGLLGLLDAVAVQAGVEGALGGAGLPPLAALPRRRGELPGEGRREG